MTISSTVRKAGPFSGNGSATVFSFGFKVFSKTDVGVTLLTAAGAVVPLTLDSDYSVTLNADQNAAPGGIITYPLSGAPLPVGAKLVADGALPYEQPTMLTNSGGFYPEVIEDAFDRDVIMIQQLAELGDRSLHFPADEGSLFSGELPAAVVRASRVLTFDANGDPTVSAEPYQEPSQVLSSAAAATSAAITAARPGIISDATGIADDHIEQIVAGIQTPTFQAFMPTTLRDGVDYASGTSTSVALPATTSGKTIAGVFFDGVFQSPTGWTLSGGGTTLTFSGAVPAGVGEINVMYFSPSLLGTFFQKGYGAIGRTFQSKMRERVSVFDFMSESQITAVKAGWSTDGGALQAAVSAVLALPNGGEVVIPDGYFQLSAPVVVPKTTKALRIRGKGGASLLRLANGANSGATILGGQGSGAGGGVDYVFEDFKICAPATGSTNGFEVWNFNGCVWRGVQFDYGVLSGVIMHSCYATRFVEINAVNLVNYLVYSYTSCHNIVFDRCMLYGVGGVSGSVLQIADGGATNNIVFRDCDMESCANIFNLPGGCSSITVDGCYIEYTANLEFFFRDVCYGLTVENCWLALNTQGGTLPSGGGSQLIVNLHVGRFFNNTIGYMTWQFDAACRDVEEGGNIILTQPSQLGLLGPAPFTPVVLQNGWTQGSRAIGYKKLSDGTVELRGVLSGGSTNITAFQMPGGYRPAQALRVPIVHEIGNTLGVLLINTDGSVVPQTLTGGTVTLDGVRFIATPQ